MKRMKHQNPNTKHQTDSHRQAPKGQGGLAEILGFGHWRFFGVGSLVFGVLEIAGGTT